jgi:hypothetical protein
MTYLLPFSAGLLAFVLLLIELLQRYIIATREPERGEWCDLGYDFEVVE